MHTLHKATEALSRQVRQARFKNRSIKRKKNNIAQSANKSENTK